MGAWTRTRYPCAHSSIRVKKRSLQGRILSVIESVEKGHFGRTSPKRAQMENPRLHPKSGDHFFSATISQSLNVYLIHECKRKKNVAVSPLKSESTGACFLHNFFEAPWRNRIQHLHQNVELFRRQYEKYTVTVQKRTLFFIFLPLVCVGVKRSARREMVIRYKFGIPNGTNRSVPMGFAGVHRPLAFHFKLWSEGRGR